MRWTVPQPFVAPAVIVAAAVLAALPLTLHGVSCGHDLPFHLLNWIDAAAQWKAGTLRPWWCSAAAWNTGEARFLFYPPLSWVTGGLLTLLLGVARAPLAYTVLALGASGFTMRRFLSSYLPAPAALLGACLYLSHPYLLFTATERTAYAELLAAAWLPWLLHEALRERIVAARLAVPVALLWLTNTPAAVLGSYSLAVVLAVRALRGRSAARTRVSSLLTRATLGFVWGLALAGLYLVPALVQHNAVEVGEAFTAGMRPEEGTLFAHTGEPFHDHVVHQASVLALVSITVAVLALFAIYMGLARTRRLHSMRDAAVQHLHAARLPVLRAVLLTLTVLVAFLLTPASLPLWRYVPELHFLQFPWRTLMLQGELTSTLVALALPYRTRLSVAALLGLVAAAVLGVATHRAYVQPCDAEDSPAHLQAEYTHGAGFEPYDEYTPRSADNDLLHAGEPPAWTAASATASATAEGAGHVKVEPGHSPADFEVAVKPGTADAFVILRQRRFPNRQVTVDGYPVPTEPMRDDDLIAVALPDRRPHQVAVHTTWSADEYAGLAISAGAVFGLGAAWRRRRAVRATA